MKTTTMTRRMPGLVVCMLAVALGGCANTGIKHVSAEEFVRQAKTMEYPNSASGTFYLGASPTRVYVERTGLYRAIRLHDAMVYWTELDGLPDEMETEIRSGKCPWTPWQTQMREVDQAPEGTARELADPLR